jgi:DNA-binding protein HU-beta
VNKSELIDAIAASADIPKAAAGRALDGALDSISSALQKGESVALVGFGTFSVKERAARTGRNLRQATQLKLLRLHCRLSNRVKRLKTQLISNRG